MKPSLLSFIVAVVAFVTYQLGILERPPFVYQEAFLNGKELLAIVATTRERNIGQHVERLVQGTKKGVESLENSSAILKAAAKEYGPDDAFPLVSIGLYFDDPYENENPRWAIGWAVQGRSFEGLQALLPQIQKASGLDDPIKVVRIGGVGVGSFVARIPWRNMLTPMIAPMLHWGRGFQAYYNHAETNGLSEQQISPPIALEVYVCEENDAKAFIDYVVLFGRVKNTWDDSFPGSIEEFGEASVGVSSE